MTSKRLTAVVLAASLAAAGCGGSAGDDDNTFRIWHYESPDSAMAVAWNKAVDQLKQRHPDLNVVVEEKGFEQIRKTASMVLGSNEAPDVLEYNKGNASTGLLAKQGLLVDLTDEVKAKGWDAKVGAVDTAARYDESGVMGGDKWYGVPNYAEYVLVYYNKDMFDQQGLQPPTTLDELTAAMDKFKSAGITPLATGGGEYPAHQVLYQLALTEADRDWVDRYQRYTGDVDFHDEAWTKGATTFADWVAKGYVNKDDAGLKAEDMGLSFMQGKQPVMITGSWWFGRVKATIKDFQWGTAAWPGKMTSGGSGNLWVVPKGSKKQDIAKEFIDITLSQEIQDVLRDSGGVALAAGDGQAADPQTQRLNEDFAAVAAADGFGFYPDWPAPGFYDVHVSAVQKLMTGGATPDQALDELVGPYRENLADIGK
ncbi:MULTISPECIES: extracellular solute-binding protein [Actinosynnema]|uniref:ABC transporter substrate-binding protein n=1 Tax=Actinosynnema TaxID=40566 RepID=UPI0020A58ACC|nr:extracellular solute-binding protein [Actinosynnema pretiosum]MCP2098445.1 carbohydrate ABC transporter substrate-binding protein, CUT1 family [Actinosynnema pretiosum]